MVETILQSDFVVYGILPFLLTFVIVFAILQKTRILGEGKKQIDALVALVIGLIVISFGNIVDIIVPLTAFMAVFAVVLLVFMMLYGMAFKEGEFEMHKYVKMSIGIIVAIAVIIAVLVLTGYFDFVIDFIFGGAGGDITNTIILFVVIIAAIIIVLAGAGRGGGGSSGKP